MLSQVVEADTNQMRVRCRNRPTQWVIPSCLRAVGGGFQDKEAEKSNKNTSDKKQSSNSEADEFQINPEASEFIPSYGNSV